MELNECNNTSLLKLRIWNPKKLLTLTAFIKLKPVLLLKQKVLRNVTQKKKQTTF